MCARETNASDIRPAQVGGFQRRENARQEALRLLQALLPPWWQELPKRPCHGGLLGASASDLLHFRKVRPPPQRQPPPRGSVRKRLSVSVNNPRGSESIIAR